METDKHTEVLIVGAGPSGLMMAAQLLRHGIQPVIIDEKPGPDRRSDTLLLSARSMELFRQLGLADQLQAKGQAIYTVQLSRLRRVTTTLDFSQLIPHNTRFPFILGAAQRDVERMLLDRLTENACPVKWKTRLESFSQDDSGALAAVEHEGTRQEWRCAWLIGADGCGSDVRQQLSIPIEEGHIVQNGFVADVQTASGNTRTIRLAFYGSSPLAIVPSGIPGRVQITGRLPAAYQAANSQDAPDFRQDLLTALGLDVDGTQFLRFTPFNYRKTVAEQVRRQRCFLIGDAAHRVSPLLNGGVNEGFYDAVNLAWKLAGVVSGRMVPGVLDTYRQERLPAVKAGGGIFGLGEADPFWPGWLRKALVVKQVTRAGRYPDKLQQIFLRLAGLDVNYRLSPLSVHHALGTAIHAGDRIPGLPVFDEKSKTQTDLHRWCEKAAFVLLVLGTISHHQLNIIGQWMRQKYPREMQLYYLPYSHRNRLVFDTFEVKPDGTKMMLIRPDMHIAYMNDVLNVALIDTYMEEVLGWAFFGRLPEKQ